MILQTWMNMLYVGNWVLHNDRKSYRDKANIDYHKKNKSCSPIHSQPHFSRVCGKLTRIPTSSYWDGAPSCCGVQQYALQHSHVYVLYFSACSITWWPMSLTFALWHYKGFNFIIFSNDIWTTSMIWHVYSLKHWFTYTCPNSYYYYS